jgi:hypothetical protein
MTTPSSLPMVSVVMAVYNVDRYLEEAIQSILNQTFRDFEFIIIDDGSTDLSSDLLHQYAERDKRIQLFIQENIGLTKSLNRGLSMASGEFIARMDPDDIALPDRFAKQIAMFHNDHRLVLLGCEVGLIDEAGRLYGKRGHAQCHAEIRRRLIAGDGGALTHPAIMFRTGAAQAIGGYDEEMPTAQDLDFYLKLSEVGVVANLKETLLLWRQHAGSVNHTKSQTWAEMRRYCVGKTIQRIGVQQFLEQFFLPTTHSPDSRAIDKARIASKSGLYREACGFYWSAFKSKDQRGASVYQFTEMVMNLLHQSTFRFIKAFSNPLSQKSK